MNKRRLLKLADFLEADAKNKKGICFDFGMWGDVGDEKNPVSCGTTACAFGLAAISGAFKRAGLGANIDDGIIDFTFKGVSTSALTAASKTFDISIGNADYLFATLSGLKHTVGAKGEREVAKRIRRFVAEA